MTGNEPPTAAELLALERRHLLPAIRGSAEKLRALLADEFLEFGGSGVAFDREAAIRSVAGESGYRATIEDYSVRFASPDAALATYRLSSQCDGAAEVRRTLRSSLWVRRDGGWQLLFHQGTPLKAPA